MSAEILVGGQSHEIALSALVQLARWGVVRPYVHPDGFQPDRQYQITCGDDTVRVHVLSGTVEVDLMEIAASRSALLELTEEQRHDAHAMVCLRSLYHEYIAEENIDALSPQALRSGIAGRIERLKERQRERSDEGELAEIRRIVPINRPFDGSVVDLVRDYVGGVREAMHAVEDALPDWANVDTGWTLAARVGLVVERLSELEQSAAEGRAADDPVAVVDGDDIVARVQAVAQQQLREAWHLCVPEGTPYPDGNIIDSFTEMGETVQRELRVRKMNAEECQRFVLSLNQQIYEQVGEYEVTPEDIPEAPPVIEIRRLDE